MNPYAPPLAQAPQGPACPRCRGPYVATPTFTWWGGLVGARVMGIMKCDSCGYEFYRKNGQDGSNAKWIYTLGGFVVVAILAGVIIVVFGAVVFLKP